MGQFLKYFLDKRCHNPLKVVGHKGFLLFSPVRYNFNRTV